MAAAKVAAGTEWGGASSGRFFRLSRRFRSAGVSRATAVVRMSEAMARARVQWGGFSCRWGLWLRVRPVFLTPQPPPAGKLKTRQVRGVCFRRSTAAAVGALKSHPAGAPLACSPLGSSVILCAFPTPPSRSLTWRAPSALTSFNPLSALEFVS